MNNKKNMLCSVLLVSCVACPALANNWAHWRGPTGNSAAVDAHPPLHWSSAENVKWKVAVPGQGAASPRCIAHNDSRADAHTSWPRADLQHAVIGYYFLDPARTLNKEETCSTDPDLSPELAACLFRISVHGRKPFFDVNGLVVGVWQPVVPEFFCIVSNVNWGRCTDGHGAWASRVADPGYSKRRKATPENRHADGGAAPDDYSPS